MSRAFVKDSELNPETLPERAISEHPNLVTARGLALLGARVRALEAERSAARAAADTAALARIARGLRYFQTRKVRARLVKAAPHPGQVRFGARERLRSAGGSDSS